MLPTRLGIRSAERIIQEWLDLEAGAVVSWNQEEDLLEMMEKEEAENRTSTHRVA